MRRPRVSTSERHGCPPGDHQRPATRRPCAVAARDQVGDHLGEHLADRRRRRARAGARPTRALGLAYVTTPVGVQPDHPVADARGAAAHARSATRRAGTRPPRPSATIASASVAVGELEPARGARRRQVGVPGDDRDGAAAAHDRHGLLAHRHVVADQSGRRSRHDPRARRRPASSCEARGRASTRCRPCRRRRPSGRWSAARGPRRRQPSRRRRHPEHEVGEGQVGRAAASRRRAGAATRLGRPRVRCGPRTGRRACGTWADPSTALRGADRSVGVAGARCG